MLPDAQWLQSPRAGSRGPSSSPAPPAIAAAVPHARNKMGEALPPEFSTVSDFVADDAQFMWQDSVFSNIANDRIDREVLITTMAEFSKYWPPYRISKPGNWTPTNK